MIYLNNGCRCSDLKVHPSNWQSGGPKTLNKPWYIHYRFYDPLFKDKYPNGYLRIIKGMNGFSELQQRRDATNGILFKELESLKNLDYSPITGYYKEITIEETIEYEIDPRTGLFDALKLAGGRLKLEDQCVSHVRSVLKYFKEAALQLKFNDKPVYDVKRRHIKMILERVGKNKGKEKWTANNYNFYRSYLMMLFTELVEVDAVESNPLKELKKQKTTVKIKETLTDAERIKIDSELRKENYLLWRLMHIFFHSGSRNTEIVRVQGKHVNLKEQKVKYLVKKGRQFQEVERPIKDIVLPLWEAAVLNCGPEQYVFSEGLKPGPRLIRPEQITRRWRNWVKKKKGITCDWYSLKHLNTTETSEIIGTAMAAKHNSHTETVLKKHYDVKGKARELQLLKSVNNAFAPSDADVAAI